MNLLLAKPEHAASMADFYARWHAHDFPHPEVYDAAALAGALARAEIAAMLAVDESGELAGSGLAWPRMWNQSLEIGPLSVMRSPDRSEIGKALFEGLRRLGLKHYGIATFEVRSESAFRRARQVGAICWGYRPGTKVEGARLLMGLLDPQGGGASRCEPPARGAAAGAFASRVRAAYPVGETGVALPRGYPVGAPRGTGTPVVAGQVWPVYHRAGHYVTVESSAGPYPFEAVREFVGVVRAKGVSDIRLTLPVHHADAFAHLSGLGFRAVAYLPGWFLRGPHRFDCVRMVSGVGATPAPGGFIEQAIERIDAGLNGGR